MWSILGIKETKDKIVIKDAYMTKLQVINPEDNEEEFKNLRAAYEDALKFADSEENAENEDFSPIGIWIKKVKELYSIFSLRINESSWIQLLEEDVCFALDSREEASNKLLEFLMYDYYLPKKIWLLFDEYFSWTEKKEELYEVFPENFINYVIDRVNPAYKDSLNYYLFEGIDDDKDYDSWISLYFKIQREINDKNFEEAKKDFSNIEELLIQHPSLDYWRLRYYLIIEDYENARKKGEALIKKCPNETFALYGMAEVEWQYQNFDEAKAYYKKCLEINPKDYNSKVGLADCYLETDELEKAEKLFEEVLDVDNYDSYVRERLYVLSDKRISQLEKECAEHEEDKKIKFILGWYYFNNYKYDEIIKLCASFTPDKEDENQYYDLVSKTYFSKEDYDKALEYIEKWQVNLDDPEIENEYKNEELEIVYYQKGRIFTKKADYISALEFFDKVLELNENKVAALDNKAFALNKLERYEESLEIVNKGLEIDYNNASLHINKCESLYKLRYFSEAMDECNIAINIYPYYIKPYLIKMKIYFIYEEFEEILAIAEELEKLNIADEETILYKIKALSSSNKLEEAESLAISMLKDKNVKEKSKIQYELAIIKYNKGLFDKALGYINKAIKKSDYEEEYLYFRAATYRKLKLFDLALKDYDTIINNKNEPNFFPFLKKAQVYEEIGKYDKSLECYGKVLELDPENSTVNNSIGEIYEILKDYDKALEYYSKQIEIEKSAYFYLNRGLLYAKINRFEEAKRDYESAMNLEPENPYPYNNLGCLYERIDKLEEAIPYYKKAIEVDTNKDDMRFYKNLIGCYSKLGKNDLAVKYYNKAIDDFKFEDELYYKKAKLLKKMKLYDEAIKAYIKGIEIHKQKEEISIYILGDFYDEISSIYRLMEKYEEAIKWSKKVLETNPNTKYGYENMGRIYDELKDYENAIKYYKMQVNVDKENGINYLLIAGAYKELGQKEEARNNYMIALDKFLKVKNKIAYEYTNIGSCYNGLENTSEALKYLEKAVGAKLCNNCMYTECYDGYYGFGEVYEREKEYETALKYYQKALEINCESKSTKEAIERIEILLK